MHRDWGEPQWEPAIVSAPPLVFAKVYFPESDPLVGILQAFGIYAVGFIARPVGAALFGHYGDRIGRKTTLIATLLLTGLSTFAVGFVPGYASIGIWGAIILTTVSFIQGLGIGGEWGGATLMAMEWARTNAHRGSREGDASSSDSPLEEAVTSELVSKSQNSLLAGKKQGIFTVWPCEATK